jgi:phospholipase C
LLLIVYDEHGGLFDLVTPPTLVRDPQFPDIPASKDFGFKFDRLRVRVPARFGLSMRAGLVNLSLCSKTARG